MRKSFIEFVIFVFLCTKY